MTSTTESSIQVIPALPPLNVGLLTEIITWAAQDDAAISGHMDNLFAGWGQWKQNAWAVEMRNGVCKSAYCLFGQAVVQKGYMLHMTHDWSTSQGVRYSAEKCAPAIETGTFTEKGTPIMEPDKNRMEEISDVAMRLLGLSSTYDEDCLSNGTNDIQQIVTLGCYFARRRGTELPIPEWLKDSDLRIGDDEFKNFLDTEDFYTPGSDW